LWPKEVSCTSTSEGYLISRAGTVHAGREAMDEARDAMVNQMRARERSGADEPAADDEPCALHMEIHTSTWIYIDSTTT